MKSFLLLFWMLALAGVKAQTVKNNSIIIGNTDSINSKILNEKRYIWVYLPPGYDHPLWVSKHFPVIYLLDGDFYFPSLTGMVHLLSVDGITTCPEMMVVAILNTDRTRDLTPTNSLINPRGKKLDEFHTSGGGENFAAFMEKELMPHIDSLYPTAPYKILAGSSLGGLAVMNILVNHTDMFNAYVAIDPSMWWDDKWLVKRAHEAFTQTKFEGRSLYLAISNSMADGMDTQRVRKDTSATTAHIRALLELKDVLQSNSGNGLTWAYRYYIDETHETVPLIAEYDAMHFIFSYYKMSNDDRAKMLESDYADIAALLKAYYANISKHIGYSVFPAEGDINWLGWYFLQMHWPQKAYQMFDLNIQNHPQSFYSYDSMGDYYSDQKENAKAIEFYNKALKLNDNTGIRKKRDELQAKK